MQNKIYAMSSFLQFRKVYGEDIKFAENLNYPLSKQPSSVSKTNIKTAAQLCDFMRDFVSEKCADGKTALMLSGGIDSAVVAAFMPTGSTAYTLKCVVPGREVTDETKQAKLYCDAFGLHQKIIQVTFEDYEAFSPALMERKNAPVHSIEIQIYKAALQAKRDGFERLLFGDSADMVFGGLDNLLIKDYTIGEYIERFSYVMPYKALKKFEVITEPFEKWCGEDGMIDSHGFLNDVFSLESMNSYCNACELGDITSIDAFLPLEHEPIDLKRIRSGEAKYIVREAFELCYPGVEPPTKIPMHRAVDEWFENWTGPEHEAFYPNCHIHMTGNQKYYIWILEKFLNQYGI